jgi:hypothetical protein
VPLQHDNLGRDGDLRVEGVGKPMISAAGA